MPQVTQTTYTSTYAPDILQPIARSLGRGNLGISEENLPFKGEDIWNAFEFSYLTPKGKPVAARCVFRFPADSPFLIESKSFKLYLFSFHQTKFESKDNILAVLQKDLQQASKASYVTIELWSSSEPEFAAFLPVDRSEVSLGICIDDEDVEATEYDTNPSLLKFASEETKAETLFSNLLKTNCPLTGQPDYASVQIRYEGRALLHSSVLLYLISFRQHNGFHEQCVEQMFTDILKYCKPEKLCVSARFTRRGGLDINPFRSNFEVTMENTRLVRQ